MRRPLLITITKYWLTLMTALLLTACGGGGGESGGGGFTLSQSSIEVSGYQHTMNTSRHNITMNITGDGATYAGAAYTNGQTPVNWLSFEMTGSGKSYVLSVYVNPSVMSTGKSTAAFTVGTTDSKGNVLATKVVTVTADLRQGMQASTTEKNDVFVYGAVASNLSFPLSFSADNRTSWRATSNQNWLNLSQSAGQGSASLAATVDTTALTPGSHQAEITIQDNQDTNHKFTFIYRLHLDTPMFDFIGEDGVLGGSNGLAQDSLSLYFSPRTGSYNHPYSISFTTSNGVAWLTTGENEGVVNETGKTLQIRSIAPDSMAGTYTATATLRVNVGQLIFERVLNITLHKEFNRISLGSNAVALSSAPDKSLLSRKIPVMNSLNRTDLTWQAVSDQPWLTVTATGAMGQDITLEANPAGLTPEQTYYATVTVTPNDAIVGNSEQIKVGFSVLTTVPTTQVLTIPRTDSTYEDKVFRAVSPNQPVIVIGYGATLVSYNIHTAALLRSFDAAIDGVGGIAYSADGAKLFVYDNVKQQIVSLDATTGVKLDTYQLSNIFSSMLGLLHVRQNGRNMLYGVPGKVYDTDTGVELTIAEHSYLPAGNNLNADYSPQHIVSDEGLVFNSYYSALNGGQVYSQYVHGVGSGGGSSGQSCYASSGDYIYTAAGSPYSFLGYNRQLNDVDRILPGQAYPNAIVCAKDGLIIGGTNAYYDANDIFLYTAEGSALGMLNSAGSDNGYRRLVKRGLSVSSDAGQLIAVSEREGDTQIKFMRLPAAN